MMIADLPTVSGCGLFDMEPVANVPSNSTLDLVEGRAVRTGTRGKRKR
jgi:hypothetical protein